MKMTGGEIALRTLENLGVRHIFGMPGGVVLPLYDHFIKLNKLRHILIRHEQAGAFAADAYARVTGSVGVCLGTSGPGSTNLVTGIAGAYMDSVPLLVLTGQVASGLIGSDAFQETDSIGVTMPIVKHSFLVQRPEEFADTLTTAYYLAHTGRPGPVHVDMTKDAFMGEALWRQGKIFQMPGYRIPHIRDKELKRAARKFDRMLDEPALRPLVIAGHGVELSKAESELLVWVEKLNFPIVNTLLGTGTFPQDHPQWLGPVGMHGTAVANKALAEANVVIGIGMRFDDRVTGSLESFKKGRRFVHFDIDPSEIGKIVEPEVAFVGDAKDTLARLVRLQKRRVWTTWWKQIHEWEKLWPPKMLPRQQKSSGLISTAWAIDQLSKMTRGEDIVTADVGRHQMWLMRYYRFKHPRSHVSHGGLGAMGYGFPAGYGAKLGAPYRRVWSVVGDGSFQINLQELATIVENAIDIKIVIMNDASLGMVRQWQELFYHSNLAASTFSGNPDFVKLAASYGVPGKRVQKPSELVPAYRWAMRHRGAVLIDVRVDPTEHVYPMVPAGKGVHEQIISDPRWEKKKAVDLRAATSD